SCLKPILPWLECENGMASDALALQSVYRLPELFRFCVAGFPNPSQWAFDSVNRIVLRPWQGSNIVIGFRALAREPPKQVPLTTAGVSSDNTEIVAGTNVLVCHPGRDDNHIARMHLDVLAMLTTESQSGSARINTEHFMRRAVIMRKGIDSVSPRVGPVVFGKTLFENGRRIFGIGCDCLPIKQQRKGTIWENTVVFEIQLLGLNKIVLLSHAQFSRVKVTQERSELVLAAMKL